MLTNPEPYQKQLEKLKLPAMIQKLAEDILWSLEDEGNEKHIIEKFLYLLLLMKATPTPAL